MENWKPIAGYEGLYEVSDQGRVRNARLRGRNCGNVLSLTVNNGYHRAMLCDNGRDKLCKVCRLVAIAFIPNPENKPQVNHKNGIKTDDRVENLEWATAKENSQHSVRTGLWTGNFGTVNGSSKLDDTDVRIIRQLHREQYPHWAIAEWFGITKASVSDIGCRRTWGWLQ